ncbi:MAG: 4Fe-4S dicluster domain-containing protein [Kiritimatiellae bacterium]|nr:4Fe-4S dicluster domain-containing protein [Kiritimatiellia bacterium]
MDKGIIEKKALGGLVEKVTQEARFYGPVKGESGAVLAEIGPDQALCLDYSNFVLPLKRLFFPQSEVISTGETGVMRPAPAPEERIVVFGVRPCDADALLYLDKIFCDEQAVDPYYRQRRENAILIALACKAPCPSCFCVSLDSGPASDKGADVLAFDLGDAVLLEAVSAKGRALTAACSDLLREPTDEDLKARDEQASAAERKLEPVDVMGVSEKIEQAFDAPLWDAIARRCLACGVCTFLCPTCHCFGFSDEPLAGKTKRIRFQDACMFPLFTLEASGHNPRTTQGQRLRQRISHKFSYTVKNQGDIFCVGCGRCVQHCPVNIDLREILAEVKK